MTMLFDGRIVSGITVFVAVARAGSFPKAASHIGLSRSGVAKAIARLEERTTLRLFDRTSRAIKLTDEGRLFLDEVSPLLDRLGRAAQGTSAESPGGHIRIAVDPMAGEHLVLPVVTELMVEYPRLRIDLAVTADQRNLLADGFDAAVNVGASDVRQLDRHGLAMARLVTCAAPAYLDRHGVPDSPEALLDGHSLISGADTQLQPPEPWMFRHALGETRTIRPTSRLQIASHSLAIAACLRGYGVAQLPEFSVAADVRAGRLVEVLPSWNAIRVDVSLFMARDAYVSPAMTHLVAALRHRASLLQEDALARCQAQEGGEACLTVGLAKSPASSDCPGR